MLSLIQNFAIAASQKSELDSLKFIVKKLEFKADQMQRVLDRTEVGQGYFTFIIYLQLSVFLVLVGLGGWIGWATIMKRLTLDREAIESKNQTTIVNEIAELNKTVDAINSDMKNTIYNVNRSMFFTLDPSGDYLPKFQWALASAASLHELDPEDEETIKFWLKSALLNLKKISVGALDTTSDTETFNEDLNKLKLIEKVDLVKIRDEILKHFNHIIHTIPTPPADLFKDIIPSVTPKTPN